ncbi:HI1506-related protein [Salmonella enterica]|uniref:HI1506-related protein n=1 Tax=Salmonella enterica TaxID=28901 RepID=UPI0009A9AC89|nr:HI1506-related protein [Salmonella enterica]
MSEQENNAALPGGATDNPGTDGDSQVTPSGFFIVEVRCPRERYIRAGIRFIRGKQTLENVPQATLDILQADPCLIVVSVQPAAAPSGEAGVQNLVDVVNAGSDVTPAEINKAIDALIVRADPQSFTKSGVPGVKAVSDELGQPVTKAQVDAAWTARQERQK